MNPSIEELHQSGRYESLEIWEHANIVQAIQPHLRRYSWVSIPYFVISIGLVYVLIWRWISLELDFWDGLAEVGWGILLGYFLIIPHEHIHGFVYRLLGFKNIKIFYNIRQMNALCVADREVLDGKQLMWVAIAPFAVLNSILLILAFVFPQTLVFWAALTFHVAACSGDFAILNFMDAEPKERVFTYDDVAEKKTYFFRALTQA